MRQLATRMQLYEDQEEESQKPISMPDLDHFHNYVDDVQWSEAEAITPSTGWESWDSTVRPFLTKLHEPNLQEAEARRLWSDYRGLVKEYPEISAFLRVIFRQIGPHIYFDHLESLYFDIVATNQLTTVIGRDMVQHYLARSDLAAAESVAADLEKAGLPISGSTISMLVRLAGFAGNERKVWQYFDSHVQTDVFSRSSYPYLCGSLFVALSYLPGTQDSHVLSILHLMISTEEYYPNSPEYYKWLEQHDSHPSDFEKLSERLTQEASEQSQPAEATTTSTEDITNDSIEIDVIPDFPMQRAVRLPPPDAFCFNVAFVAIKEVGSAQIIWDLAQKLRRITPSVYSRYIISLSRIDVTLAVKVFKEYMLTAYASKSPSITHKLRSRLMADATIAGNMEAFDTILEGKIVDKKLLGEDIVNMSKILIRQGAGAKEVLDRALALHDQNGLTALSFILRCIILEYLHHSNDIQALEAAKYAAEKGWTLHYHHQSPIPLWYFHQWLDLHHKNKTAGQSATPEDKEREAEMEAKFLETNDWIFNSPIGPSAFYLRVVASLHPSSEFAHQFLDRGIERGITASALVYSIHKTDSLPFTRAYDLVRYLSTKYDGKFSPVVAKSLLTWGAAEGHFRECFDIGLYIIDNALSLLKQGLPMTEEAPANVNVAEVPMPSFILGAWVAHFCEHVCAPFGIKSSLYYFHAYHNKYKTLTEQQMMDMRHLMVQNWFPRAMQVNFVPKQGAQANISKPSYPSKASDHHKKAINSASPKNVVLAMRDASLRGNTL